MDLLKEGIEKEIVTKTEFKKKLYVNGSTKAYDVYKIKISHLFFNDKNDRIATFIDKYKHEKNITNFDKSDLDEYNKILHDFIKKSNIQAYEKTRKNIEIMGQRECGVVLRDGRIIDGNRRFTCLRSLSKDDIKFEYFNAVILDESIENNERAIKMLELSIQHGEDEKVSYDPIDKLVGIYNDIIENKLLSIRDYAKSINKEDRFVEGEIRIAELIVDYLKFLGEDKKFYIARDYKLDGPIREIDKILRKIDEKPEREKQKFALFTILSIQKSGDLTRNVRDFGKKILGTRRFNEFYDNIEPKIENIKNIYKDKNKNIEEKISIIMNGRDAEYINDSVELYVNKANSELSKNKPIELIQKAFVALNGIDFNIFVKLNSEQINQVNKWLIKIEQLCSNLRGKTGCSEN